MKIEGLWFEPVGLLERCSLNEGLLWIWAERVPINNVYREKNAFESLQDWECAALNIPPVPEGIRHAAHHQTEERAQDKYSGMKPVESRKFYVAKAMQEAKALKAWIPTAVSAMEVPASELFLALRRGRINTSGKQLPVGATIIDFLEEENSYGRSDFHDLSVTAIPPDIWTMSGIDWFANAVSSNGVTYCDVSMSVEALFFHFPGQPASVEGAEFVGDCLVVRERAELHQQRPLRSPGRPPTFAWDAFHVEVTDLIKNGVMPKKKEAAIQQMMSWFENTQGGQRPSRSAVSDKLTPYYRRFFSAKG